MGSTVNILAWFNIDSGEGASMHGTLDGTYSNNGQGNIMDMHTLRLALILHVPKFGSSERGKLRQVISVGRLIMA